MQEGKGFPSKGILSGVKFPNPIGSVRVTLLARAFQNRLAFLPAIRIGPNEKPTVFLINDYHFYRHF